MSNFNTYDVFLKFKLIDTVMFEKSMTAEEVKKSLVNHDDYDPNIVVVLHSK